MNVWIKRVLVGAGALVGVVGLGGGLFAWTQASAFTSSMERSYEIPVPQIALSTDPAVLERGRHLAESVAPCASSDCHGKDLAGGKTIVMGPLGTFTGPNVTKGGLAAAYGPGELARLIQHGIKKDGRSVRFMPVQDWSWMPESDVTALVSYLQTVPAVDRPNGETSLGLLAKILDRQGMIVIDVARKVDNAAVGKGPAPSPTREYGEYLGKLCQGCHGDTLSGGPLPGAPPDFPVPTNLTPHETGLQGWAFADFEKLLVTGIRPDGTKVNEMMPTESFGKLDDTEKRALFAYLQSVPPMEFGSR
jgi:hypothetical protein